MSIKNKKYFTIIFLLTLLIGTGADVLAGKRYWVGTGANINWNSTGNWSTTSGGASGAAVPGSTDSVYYDGNGIGQCSINATVSVSRFEMGSGYTDTVKQNSYVITIGTSGMVLSSGVFQGGSGNMTNNGIFTLSGANFISTSGIFNIYGDYTFSSGTFSHNNGDVWFRATSTIDGNTAFYNLNFSPVATSIYTIDSSTTLTVHNELKTAGTASMQINTGTIDLKGDITISNTYNNSVATGGSGTIVISDTTDQTINGTSTIGLCRLCNIEINKSSGNLIFKNFINIGGNFNYIQGSIDDTTNTSELVFCNSAGRTISGKPLLRNLTFYAPSANTSTIADTITVTGTLKTSGLFGVLINSGVINLKGDLTITNTNGGAGTNTATIVFSGNANQLLTGTSVDLQGRLCNIKIDKTGGTLSLKNTITLSANRNWTYVQGNIDVSTYDSKLVFSRGSSSYIDGTHTLKNVTFTSEGVSGGVFNMDTNDTLTVTGELRFEGNTYSVSLNTGNIHAKGDITITNTSASNILPTARIKICGTGDQTITGTATPYLGRLCNIEIDKPSGTLILKNAVTISSNCSWKLINGTLDATTYSSTLAFARNNMAIEGNQTLYNLVFSTSSSSANYNIPASDTITVLGELKTEGNYAIGINNGTIKAKGDITLTNTYTGSHPTNNGTISICGTGTQTFTGSGVTTTGKICNIKIDKPSGTLNLSSIINMDHNWDYVRGTVNAGTSTCVFNGGSSPFVNTLGTNSSMSFYNFATYSSVILNSNITCTGNVKINTSSSLNGNSKSITLGGDWDNSGTFTYASTDVIFNGSERQRTIKSSGTENFHNLTVNKSSQNLLLGSPVTINNNLQLTKGIIGTTSTNYINIPNDKTCSAGSDSSFVCGPMRKTGDDAFTFPIGDTLISSGKYHPLTITVPSDTTDAFTAQYYSTNQEYGSTLQTDSLSSISNCEHWLLTRTTGTSVVIPSLGWNSNSCNVDLCHKMRVAGWNGTQWNSMGIGSLTSSGNTGVIGAASGISIDSLPLVIARPLNSSLYPTVSVSASEDTICSGTSSLLIGSGANTYNWSPSTGLSATTGDSVTASPATTTTYTLVGTNSYGCMDTATVTINVLVSPSVSVTPVTSSINGCSASGVTLTASGAVSYSWAPSTGLSSTTGSVVTAYPTASITYTVTGTAANGCTKTATAVVIVSSTLNISISSTGFTSFVSQCSNGRFPPVICNYSGTVCRDSSLTLTASGCSNPNLTYTWSLGDTVLTGTSVSYTYTALLNDTITLTVIDTTGNIDTLIKYIPVTVYPCLPVCCQHPYLYVTDTSGLDTAINVALNPTIFLCDNLTYNFSSSCYHPDTTNVSWVFADTDPGTPDSTYTGNDLTLDIGSGTYTLTMTSYGPDCDTIITVVTIQTMTCEPSCADCLGSFSPIPGKKYLLSAWVKEENASLTKTSYTYPEIIIASPSVSYTISAAPSGRIIDGWQRVEKEFILPLSATDIHIELKCTTGNCYFDDIRVFPIDGSMKSYVYDPVNMRLTAELDERNYATFYEYDEEGKLVRVKKETEKGIMTLKENRNKTKK